MGFLTKHLKILATLSFMIMIISFVASIGGLFFKGLYNDNALVQAAWKGNDLVTLFIAVPLMAFSLFLFQKGSVKGLLLWMGALWYMLYNYMFYLFGAAFNEFFLLYVALFTMSGYAFILSLLNLNVEKMDKMFTRTKWLRFISGFILFFGLMLGIIEIAMCFGYIATGEIPLAITRTDHPTGVVFAADLSILIPFLIVGGILLWQDKAWGFILSAIALIKASSYGLVLLVMSHLVYRETGVKDAMLPLWMFLTLGCWISTFLLFRHFQQDRIGTTE